MPRGAGCASGGAGGAGFVGDASSQGMVVGRAPLRSLVLPDASARAGLLAGLLVGGTGLVRVDALREVVLLLPVLALGAAFGGRWVRPVLVGLAGSLLVAAVAAVGLSWQYLASIAASLVPLLALGVLIGGGSWVALVLWRRGWRLPSVVVAVAARRRGRAVVLAGLYLASRPLWQTVRQDPNDPGSRYVAGMQARQGLPVDGGRTYAEQTVAWLSWYVGPVALVGRARGARRARAAGGAVGRLAQGRRLAAGAVRGGGLDAAHPAAPRHHARPPVGRPPAARRAAAGRGPGGAPGWPGRWRSRGRLGRRWVGVVAAGVVGILVVVPAAVATWPHRAGGVERGSLAAVDVGLRRA